jgi:HEAT repeat protein
MDTMPPRHRENPSSARAVLLGCSVAGIVACLFCLPAPAAAANDDLTAAQKLELETLRSQLADPARTARTKLEAASLLLTRDYPEATAALVGFLTDQSNRPAQVAVTEAIARTGRTRPEFVKPLLAMLTGSEPSIRAAAAGALSAYSEQGVITELVGLAGDRRRERPVRLATISALGRIYDKRAVDALVDLLDETDAAICEAACDALASLTSIQAFGHDRGRWRQWWKDNRDKTRDEWLADLANSLARANQQLDRTNAELRRRLESTLHDLYVATPPDKRDELLTRLLKDPLAEARLAGMQLTQQWLAGTPEPSAELAAAIRTGVTDPSPEVRAAAAVLVGGADGAEAVELLAGRLEAEKAGKVREAIYRGLGLQRDAKVIDLLIGGVGEPSESVATAAAAALARVAEGNHLSNAQRTAAVKGLTDRFKAAGTGQAAAPLREALLGAMGALKDPRLADLMRAALGDPQATVRLSAVKGLGRLGRPEAVAAVAELTGDDDRGVRLAALSVVQTMGTPAQLDAVLARTDPAVEPDETVREQAWTAATALLAKADVARLEKVAEKLAGQPALRGRLVEVLRLRAEKTPRQPLEAWTAVRLRLCEALLAASRPAEAARELADVHAALAEAGDDRAGEVRLRWIAALLAAGDASAIERIAETDDAELFDAAVDRLVGRLRALEEAKDWDALIRLAAVAQERLKDRLKSDPDAEQIADLLRTARAEQRKADRQRVAGLLDRLTAGDEAVRAAARKEIAAMNGRAVRPLVDELRGAVAAQPPDASAEDAILALLASLAPQLKGYDPKAPVADRVKVVETWLRQLGS